MPPPKSVTAQSVPHPFLEISVLEYTSPAHMDMKQYKYIHALIQVPSFLYFIDLNPWQYSAGRKLST